MKNMFGQSMINRYITPTTRCLLGSQTSLGPVFNFLTGVQSSLPQDFGACRYRSNRSRRGLYDGRDIRSGNTISFSNKHNKRKFKPNVFTKRVYSEILDEMVRFHLTAGTLRSIDKAGGLDNYLLTSSYVTSGEGLEVKRRIISKLGYLDRVKAREELSASS